MECADKVAEQTGGGTEHSRVAVRSTTLLISKSVKLLYSFDVIFALFGIVSEHEAGFPTFALNLTQPESPGESSCAFQRTVRSDDL